MSAELSGLLRERVTLERQAPGRSSLGVATGAWLSLGQCWAAVVPMGEGAGFVGDAPAAPARFHVTIRVRKVFGVGDRVVWRGRTLVVLNATFDPTLPDRMTCLTEEVR
jgi:head-tail adaptor